MFHPEWQLWRGCGRGGLHGDNLGGRASAERGDVVVSAAERETGEAVRDEVRGFTLGCRREAWQGSA